MQSSRIAWPEPMRIVSSSDDQVLALLRERFTADAGALEPLAGGEFSRAFTFAAGRRTYVVRISSAGHAPEAFAKDERAGQLFASPRLPIPRVVARGDSPIGAFCISELAVGRRTAELDSTRQRALLPALLDTLDAIGQVDLGDDVTGYGAWDANGRGGNPSWRAFLADVLDDHERGYYKGWHRLFETTFLERDVYERVYRRMVELLPHCPENRRLIHNDYHFDNVLSDGEGVTGVLDWGNACYGDALFDAAWVGRVFGKDYGIDALSPLRERHGHLPRYDERMACYTMRIGLDDMRFYAKTGRQAQYASTRATMLALAHQ